MPIAKLQKIISQQINRVVQDSFESLSICRLIHVNKQIDMMKVVEHIVSTERCGPYLELGIRNRLNNFF